MIGKEALAPLRHRGFRAFLGARFTSLLGNAIAPIAVAFAVLDLTNSASALGMVLAARMIPTTVLMLFGGVIADRLPRHIVLVTANVVCFATQAAAAGLLLSGHAKLWQIVVIEVLNGAAAAFTFPAMQGLMPHLVPRDQLQQANALSGLVRSGTAIGGASLGGVIVGFLGSGWGLAVDAASFGIAALFLIRLRIPPAEHVAGGSVAHDLRVGWREFVSRRWVWVIVAAFGIMNAILAGGWSTLGPVVADGSFGRMAWGVVLSCQSAGTVLGMLVLLRFRPRHPLRLGMIGMLAEAPMLLVLGIDPEVVVLASAALAAGVGGAMFGIAWETSLQQHVPHDKLSRVSSYDALGSWVAMPVGQLLAGPLAAAFGVEQVIVVGAVIYAGVAALTLVDPSVRGLTRADQADRSEPAEAGVPT
ncbi:MFS transporter [Actinopolymorpha alba]|uniref:MFS transporter n=1 Tax=Actinopolymorpha alba TaxID=533267 RepID=UPI00037BD3FD|nr:MFS transporter [Actinopolymorpha alba]